MKKINLIIFVLAIYSSIPAQDMKGMKMDKKGNKEQPAVTYTCPMHPEIHAAKPGNCPKCGMKLVKEKPKLVENPVSKKTGGMEVKKDSAKPQKMVMDDKPVLKMDGMPMQRKDTAKKNEHIDGMNMANMDHSQHQIPQAKAPVTPMQKTAMDKRRSMTDVAQLVMDEFEKN
jgi:hypothetical protein